MPPPNVGPAIEGARAALLAWLDRKAGQAPPEWQPGLAGIRAEIASSSVLPANLVGEALTALGQSVLSGDFGPASHSDADVA